LVEIGLLLFILAVGGVGFNLLRRPDAGPLAYWSWGGFALLGSGVSLYLIGDSSRWSVPIGYALGTLYPMLLLLGAMVFAGHPRPRGAISAALATGLARGLLEEGGQMAVSHVIGLLVEPTVAVAAAVFVFRATRSTPIISWQQALAPSLVLMAGLDAASAIWLITAGPPLPDPLIGVWILGASLTLALQIAGVSDRTRDALEQRVDERTAELAQSVSVLEKQIAERRAAEAALRESEERYRILSEMGSDYAFALRVDRNLAIHFDWASGALARVTGYHTEELQGHGWHALVHPDDGKLAFTRLAAALEEREREMDVRIVHKEGEVRWIQIRFQTSIRGEEDGVARIVGTVRDVTERKQAEEERRQLDLHMGEMQRLDSLGVLAGGIAHDFNNMLAVIRGSSRLALADLDAGVAPRLRLDRIRSATEHAMGLTEQMLTYSGRPALTLSPLDLTQLVRDTRTLLRASVTGKGCIEFDLEDDLAAVEGDFTRIQQVVLNLASNASEALGEGGGTIRIATGVRAIDARDLSGSYGTPDAAPGEYVALEVSDTGPGIDPEIQQRIFEPFFTTRSTGRGLGLAGVLGIVVAHRGVIRIESRPGAGTMFQVLLPRSAAAAERAPEPGESERLAPKSGRVLVVDDDESVLDLACEFLERAGFDVLAACGGQVGIDLFRTHSDDIDAVVLDLVMPGVGGVEAFVEILRIRPEMPVVVTSGYDKEKAVERFSARGFSSFLYKPYEPEELVESVCKALIRDPR
jgi:PAS domain S-box-containing protein